MIKLVLFDLDGTLFDTRVDIIGAVNDLRAEYDRPVLETPNLFSLAAEGSKKLLPLAFDVVANSAEFLQLQQQYFEKLAKRFARRNPPLDGVEKLLLTLQERKLAWGVVTNRHAEMAHDILKNLPATVSPAIVVNRCTAGQRKPDASPILYACEQLGILPGNTLMVGDLQTDLEAARAAGCNFVLARFLTEVDRREISPSVVVARSPMEVLNYL